VIEDSGKGRPRTYCSDNCRDFNKFYDAMERNLARIQFSTESAKEMRGKFFRTRNDIKVVKG